MARNNGMTAHELAQELLRGPDLPVRFAYNYGDHWRTQVAATVETVDRGYVAYSDYHQMDKMVDTDREEQPEEDAKDCVEVVILS